MQVESGADENQIGLPLVHPGGTHDRLGARPGKRMVHDYNLFAKKNDEVPDRPAVAA